MALLWPGRLARGELVIQGSTSKGGGWAEQRSWEQPLNEARTLNEEPRRGRRHVTEAPLKQDLGGTKVGMCTCQKQVLEDGEFQG